MARPAKIYRGSKRRIERIRLGGNWSVEVLIILGVVLLVVLGVIPWLL